VNLGLELEVTGKILKAGSKGAREQGNKEAETRAKSVGDEQRVERSDRENG
jgi:hypothetical protein